GPWCRGDDSGTLVYLLRRVRPDGRLATRAGRALGRRTPLAARPGPNDSPGEDVPDDPRAGGRRGRPPGARGFGFAPRLALGGAGRTCFAPRARAPGPIRRGVRGGAAALASSWREVRQGEAPGRP